MMVSVSEKCRRQLPVSICYTALLYTLHTMQFYDQKMHSCSTEVVNRFYFFQAFAKLACLLATDEDFQPTETITDAKFVIK